MDLIRAAMCCLSSFVLQLAAPVLAADAVAAASGAGVQATETRLHQLFERDAQQQAELDPIDALYRGEYVSPAALASLFTDGLDRRRQQAAQQALRELAAVDRNALGPEAGLSFDVFKGEKQEDADWLQPYVRSLTGVRPFNHFAGIHVEFPSLMSANGSHPFDTPQDYRAALELDRAFAVVLDNAVLRFREGLADGVVEPQLTVSNMIEQIDAILARPVEDSPFYSPVRAFPDTVSRSERQQLRRAYSEVITGTVRPAYRRLRDFLEEEYLPMARPEAGLWAMKGGRNLYRRLIERETTLPLDPDELHELGLAEVARIERDMEAVRDRIGFSGSLPEFFEHIRTEPSFHPQNRRELADGYAAIHKQVGTKVEQLFSDVPATPLRIAPYPAFRERYEPGAAYYQGAADGTRAGTFLFNTYDLPSRFLTGMTTLYLHEAVPGHHFQISLAQENEQLPDFQRFGGNNAFIEGWALYAESLGHEMGLFDDPLQHWGNLDDEMLRAMRLVVDTGIHAQGWNRQRAIDFMLAHSGMSRTDATQEVERYIANPAQALSYKVGALKIAELRRRGERALGERFDIREFHSEVLGSGALPLPILEAKIDRWIAGKR